MESTGVAGAIPGSNYQLDFCVFSGYERNGFYGTENFAVADPMVFNKCFFGLPATVAAASGAIRLSGGGYTFNTCYMMATHEEGFHDNGVSNVIFNNCIFAGNNRDGSSSTGSVRFGGGAYIDFNNCDFYSSPYCITVSGVSAFRVKFNGCNIAQKGSTQFGAPSGFNFGAFADSAVDATLVNCVVSGTDPVTSTGPSVIPMNWQNVDNVTNKNIIWNRTGQTVTTGTGLADTTVRTGTYAVKLVPRAAIYTHFLEFNIVAFANSAVSCLGFIKRNNLQLTSAVIVELLLPDSITADATATLSTGSEDWELWSVFADYTGSVDRLATIRIIAPFEQTGGAIYVDDIFNGANTFTKFDTWHDGGPVKIMTNQLGNPREVWDVANAGHATGTMGKLAADNEIRVDDAALLGTLK